MAVTKQKPFSIKPNFNYTVVAPASNYKNQLQQCVNNILSGQFAANPLDFYKDVLSLALNYRGLNATNFGLVPEELAPHFKGLYTHDLNSVSLNGNMISNPARLAETIITLSHETRHKFQKDNNYLHKIFGSTNHQFMPGSLAGIGRLLGAANENLDQILYPCAKTEYDAFMTETDFAKEVMQEAFNQSTPHMQQFIQKQLEVIMAFENYHEANIKASVENLAASKIPDLYSRANLRFNQYLSIAKACDYNKPLTTQQQTMLDDLSKFEISGKNNPAHVHNLVGMARLLSFCPIRDNVKGYIDYLRTVSDGRTYTMGVNLIKDYNLPITQSDLTKVLLKSDMYHVVQGSQYSFMPNINFLSGIEESVMIQNLLATQGKVLARDWLRVLNKLNSEGKLNNPGQNHINLSVLEQHINNYSDRPLTVFNGQSVYGTSQLLDSVFNAYIQNNPQVSVEEENAIYCAMSDNLSNIISHFPNFSPNNKEVTQALNKFIASPFEKQFEDRLEYINQTSASLAPQMAQAMGRYADSQNPEVVQNNNAFLAQGRLSQTSNSNLSRAQNISNLNENFKDLDAQEVEQLLNETFTALANAITSLCQVLTSLTEVLNSPQVQEVFAKAGADVKVNNNLQEEVLGNTPEGKVGELREIFSTQNGALNRASDAMLEVGAIKERQTSQTENQGGQKEGGTSQPVEVVSGIAVPCVELTQ